MRSGQDEQRAQIPQAESINALFDAASSCSQIDPIEEFTTIVEEDEELDQKYGLSSGAYPALQKHQDRGTAHFHGFSGGEEGVMANKEMVLKTQEIRDQNSGTLKKGIGDGDINHALGDLGAVHESNVASVRTWVGGVEAEDGNAFQGHQFQEMEGQDSSDWNRNYRLGKSLSSRVIKNEPGTEEQHIERRHGDGTSYQETNAESRQELTLRNNKDDDILTNIRDGYQQDSSNDKGGHGYWPPNQAPKECLGSYGYGGTGRRGPEGQMVKQRTVRDDGQHYPSHAVDNYNIDIEQASTQVRRNDKNRYGSHAPNKQILQQKLPENPSNLQRTKMANNSFHFPSQNDRISNGSAQGHPSNYSFSSPLAQGQRPTYNMHGMGIFPQQPLPFLQYQGTPQYSMYGQANMHGHHPNGFHNAYQQTYFPLSLHGHHLQAPTQPPALRNPSMDPQIQAPGKRRARDLELLSCPDDDEETSDDDEPLITRIQRDRSLNLTLGHKFQHPQTGVHSGQQDDARPVASRSLSRKTLPHATSLPTKAKRVPQSFLQDSPQALTQSSSSPNNGAISWKLPQYAVEPQPLDSSTEQASVKISIPGLVRELLLLSPDHAAQEVHLFAHIFLPGQQKLAIPDPQPMNAVLNFHTVCVIVLDAFTQFEYGDEVAQQYPRSFAPANEDTPLERVQDAQSANVDEIFFAIIDRWRVGLSQGKASYTLIRGVQEFCDIALDIIYYIKDHGLLHEVSHTQQRRQRCDKGAKRGPQASRDMDGIGPGTRKVVSGKQSKTQESGKKVSTKGTVKVNTLHPRKKPKAESKGMLGGVTVIPKTSSRRKN